MPGAKGRGDTAAQVARAHARAEEVALATGFSGGRNSSGIPSKISFLRKREFAEIEDQASFVGDIVGYISDGRVTTTGAMLATIHVPAAYSRDMMDLIDASRRGLSMLRMYVVPRPPFTPTFDDEVAAGRE